MTVEAVPVGIYNLQFEGSASVTAHGGCELSGIRATNAGVTRMQIEVTHYDNSWLKFRGVTTASPVRDLKMVSDADDIGTTQTFGDEFLRRLEPFSTLRFLNWSMNKQFRSRGLGRSPTSRTCDSDRASVGRRKCWRSGLGIHDPIGQRIAKGSVD